MPGSRIVEPEKPKRRLPVADDTRDSATTKVNAGTVDRIVDLLFNPTREKMREVTVIDRMQGRLFPQLDMINTLRHYCLDIAAHRMNPDTTPIPTPPDALDDLLYRIAQWQKSVAGSSFSKGMDLALAEIETKGEEAESLGADPWKD